MDNKPVPPTSGTPSPSPFGNWGYPFQLPPEEPFDLKKTLKNLQKLGKLVVKEKLRFLQITGIFLVLGLIYWSAQPRLYTSSVRLLPYQSSSAGGLSGLAGLASLTGFKLPQAGTGQAGNVVMVPHYSELIQSHNFLSKIVDTPIYFGGLNQEVSYREYKEKQESINWAAKVLGGIKSYTIGLPGKILAMFRHSPDHQKGSNAPEELTVVNEEYGALLDNIREQINVSVDDETAIIDIVVQMPEPFAAADMAGLISEELKKEIILFETRKDEEQVRYLEEQYATAKDRYQRAQRTLASYSDRNRAIFSAVDQVGIKAVESDFTVALELFRNLSVELENAKIKKAKDTPSFLILQTPLVPIKKSSPNTVSLLGSFFGAGILVFAAWFYIQKQEEIGAIFFETKE
jgi:uncharacterized protein involved in exopolysaccharide biosynthesis